MIHTYTYLQVILEKQDKESVLKYEGLWGGKKKRLSLQWFHLPEERSFLQQSEKPLKAAKWRGNIPCMPRLKCK